MFKNTKKSYNTNTDINISPNCTDIKIALIDNDKEDINYFLSLFASFNLNIYTYDDCSDSELYKCGKFNVVILKSPLDKKHIEFLKNIKNNPENILIPVFVVLDKIDVDLKLSLYQLGIDYIIQKPFNSEIIICQIINILRMQAEFFEQVSKREHFIAAITHDLKTPVNAEISALQLLIQNKFGNINENQREILCSLLNSAKYMKHITDQILSFYKFNNNGIVLHKENVELSEIILSAVDSIRFLMFEKNQTLKIDNKIQGLNACIDVIEIKRLITNLISNAVENSPDNSEIALSLSILDNNFVIIIKDNGYGIDVSEMKNIFDEYVSLSKKQKRVGFGIGLNICKNIIDAHGGDINLQSEVGIGTTVKLKIPM